jgi:hypothetical protein
VTSTRRDTPPLRVRIADRSLRQVNPVLKVLAELLDLADDRLTGPQVYDLLSRAPVRARFGFTDDDLARIEAWIPDLGIRWGLDAADRDRFDLGGVDANTWRFGMRGCSRGRGRRRGPPADRRHGPVRRRGGQRRRARRPARGVRHPPDRAWSRRCGSRAASATGPRAHRRGAAADADGRFRRLAGGAAASARRRSARAGRPGRRPGDPEPGRRPGPARRPAAGTPDAGKPPDRRPHVQHARPDAGRPPPGRVPARHGRRQLPPPDRARRRRPDRPRPVRRRPRPAHGGPAAAPRRAARRHGPPRRHLLRP